MTDQTDQTDPGAVKVGSTLGNEDLSKLFSVDDSPGLIDPDKNYLEELVGENRKFKTVEALAKGKAESDAYIRKLQTELAELRQALQAKDQDLATRIKYEDFLRRLGQATGSPGNADVTSPEKGEPAPTKVEAKLPEEVIETTVESVLAKREQKRAQEANLSQVVSALRETFGDNYKHRVQQQAQRLGVDITTLTDIAARSPEAFYTLMEMKSRETFSPPPRSQVSLPRTESKKNFAYYQKMRKEKGELWYFTPAVQQEIWEEAKRQGESFYRD